ncbi:MAG: type II toxin-antitoxin system VapB family antitoxin [Hyphomicrobiales bacterium]|nr:type II toxin-antitoxin system VapB family antitoxin [Hyphomicrobiales bacterium]MBV9114809.1 type II toxin-antitoxin system VapB family antitoxin [Hyphomicrobiales bacterium]MBV9518248.1 type II toxin-antitoxin system VapB family antitoxin [Hyphomicrobiales bacterium]
MLHIRDQETSRAVRELAARKGITLTEAVKLAVSNELHRMSEEIPLWDRLAPIRAEIRSWPDTGHSADKTFYDQLSGEPE